MMPNDGRALRRAPDATNRAIRMLLHHVQRVSMASVAEQSLERAVRLLALALKAREDGHGDRAETFTVMAAHCLDQATRLERVAKRGTHFRPARTGSRP